MFDAVTLYMLNKMLTKLKVVVSMIVWSLSLTCKAVSASFTLDKKGYIAYFIIGTLCRMAFSELWKVGIIFFMNANDYYNSSECYSDYYLM